MTQLTPKDMQKLGWQAKIAKYGEQGARDLMRQVSLKRPRKTAKNKGKKLSTT